MTTSQDYEDMVDRPNHTGRVIVILLIFALVTGLIIQTFRVQGLSTTITDRENTRLTYDRSNYYITAELYAVKPDGTEVVADETGKLWEINGLRVTRFDRLLLEIRNDVVTHVWSEEWARETGSIGD